MLDLEAEIPNIFFKCIVITELWKN